MRSSSELVELKEQIRSFRKSVLQDLLVLEETVDKLLPPESCRRYARIRRDDMASRVRETIRTIMHNSQAKNANKV